MSGDNARDAAGLLELIFISTSPAHSGGRGILMRIRVPARGLFFTWFHAFPFLDVDADTGSAILAPAADPSKNYGRRIAALPF